MHQSMQRERGRGGILLHPPNHLCCPLSHSRLHPGASRHAKGKGCCCIKSTSPSWPGGSTAVPPTPMRGSYVAVGLDLNSPKGMRFPTLDSSRVLSWHWSGGQREEGRLKEKAKERGDAPTPFCHWLAHHSINSSAYSQTAGRAQGPACLSLSHHLTGPNTVQDCLSPPNPLGG